EPCGNTAGPHRNLWRRNGQGPTSKADVTRTPPASIAHLRGVRVPRRGPEIFDHVDHANRRGFADWPASDRLCPRVDRLKTTQSGQCLSAPPRQSPTQVCDRTAIEFSRADVRPPAARALRTLLKRPPAIGYTVTFPKYAAPFKQHFADP